MKSEEAGHHGTLDLWQIAVSVWRQKIVIVSVTAVFVLLGLAYGWARPKSYVARAGILARVPPTVSSREIPARERKMIQGFLLSPYVESLVEARLAEQGVQNSSLDGDSLSVSYYTSGNTIDPLSAWIGLNVESHEASRARTIADAWADVVVDNSDRIGALLKSPTAAFVPSEYSTATEKLAKAQRARAELITRQEEALANLKLRLKVNSVQSELAMKRVAVAALEQRRGRLEEDLIAQTSRAKQYVEQLKRIPEVLTLTKPVSDAALLDKATQSGASRMPKYPADAKVNSQELNPVYLDIDRKAVDARAALTTLPVRLSELSKLITANRVEMDEYNKRLVEENVAIEALKNRQALGRLEANDAVSLAQSVVDKLQPQMVDAQLTNAAGTLVLSRGSGARTPTQPQRQSTRPLAAVDVVGFLIALAVGWVRHHLGFAEAKD